MNETVYLERKRLKIDFFLGNLKYSIFKSLFKVLLPCLHFHLDLNFLQNTQESPRETFSVQPSQTSSINNAIDFKSLSTSENGKFYQRKENIIQHSLTASTESISPKGAIKLKEQYHKTSIRVFGKIKLWKSSQKIRKEKTKDSIHFNWMWTFMHFPFSGYFTFFSLANFLLQLKSILLRKWTYEDDVTSLKLYHCTFCRFFLNILSFILSQKEVSLIRRRV